MQEKSTGDLRRELMEQDSIDTYIKENQTLFTDKSVAELLTELYEQKDLTKAELARRASMSEVYLHQVFSGRRNPSRDRLLCLCIGLGATLEETQELLKRASYAQLYPKPSGTRSSSTDCCIRRNSTTSTTRCFPKTKRRFFETAVTSDGRRARGKIP